MAMPKTSDIRCVLRRCVTVWCIWKSEDLTQILASNQSYWSSIGRKMGLSSPGFWPSYVNNIDVILKTHSDTFCRKTYMALFSDCLHRLPYFSYPISRPITFIYMLYIKHPCTTSFLCSLYKNDNISEACRKVTWTTWIKLLYASWCLTVTSNLQSPITQEFYNYPEQKMIWFHFPQK